MHFFMPYRGFYRNHQRQMPGNWLSSPPLGFSDWTLGLFSIIRRCLARGWWVGRTWKWVPLRIWVFLSGFRKNLSSLEGHSFPASGVAVFDSAGGVCLTRWGGWAPTLHTSVGQPESPSSIKPWMTKRVLRSSWKFEALTVTRSVILIRWLNEKRWIWMLAFPSHRPFRAHSHKTEVTGSTLKNLGKAGKGVPDLFGFEDRIQNVHVYGFLYTEIQCFFNWWATNHSSLSHTLSPTEVTGIFI